MAGKIGTCHICGVLGQLSFEHIPPKSAFNDRPVYRKAFEDVMNEWPPFSVRGKKEQRGFGAYTLCPKCNNDTGAWYGSAYADWAYQGMRYANFAQRVPEMLFNFQIFPSRVIKQVICMFFSLNSDGFHRAHPDLQRLVLNRESRYLRAGRVRLYAYYTLSKQIRAMGVSVSGNFVDGDPMHVTSELAFPPWGYVLAIDSPPPDSRLVDITFFADYRANDWVELSMRFPVLPVETWIPGDYRTLGQINIGR